MRTSARHPRTSETVPLSQRLTYLDVFRVALAVLVAATAHALRGAGSERPSVIGATVLYLAISVVGGALWRILARRSLTLFGALIIVDGIFLAWVTYATGGTDSPLRYFILLHLITVTLLASYRTGLKLALWHSLLLLATFHLTREQILPVYEGAVPDAARTFSFMAVFWLAAFLTASLAAVSERELRRRTVDVEALAHMATELETTSDPASLTAVLASNVHRHFGPDRVVVLRVDDRTASLWGSAGDGVLGDAESTAFEARSNSVLVEVLRQRGTVLVRELDPSVDTGLSSVLPGAQNLVLVPLTSDAGLLGALAVEFGSGTSRIARREIEMVERFASHGALALRNALLVEQMERLASVDALTSVANRRTFDTVIATEIKRSGRYNKVVSLIIGDIDHFKRLNDTFGHKMGDRVLRQVAKVLERNVRDIDTVARYGGEEFTIVLPQCGPDEAAMRAEELRKAVERELKSNKLTMSFGVASYPLHAPNVDKLVAAADSALYRSKCDGRNRVTAYVAEVKGLVRGGAKSANRRTRSAPKEAKRRVA